MPKQDHLEGVYGCAKGVSAPLLEVRDDAAVAARTAPK